MTILTNKSLSKISLRSILTIPFIIQTLLVAGLVGYFSFQNGQQAVKEIAHHLHDNISARIEGHLKQFLDTPHQINRLNANAFYQELPDVNSLKILEYYFWKQIQVFNSVNSISFGYKEGGIVNAGREGKKGSLYVISTDTFKKGTFNKYATDSQGNRTSLLVTVPNFDSRTRPWYSKAVEKKSAVWSDIYIVFTGHDMAISASRPVYDEHQNLLGVTLNDIFLSHISNFLKNLQIGKTGHAFVMEKSGLLVASSFDEKPFIAGNGKETKKRLYAHESTQPIIKYAAEFLAKQTDEYKKINSSVQYEMTIGNRLYYLQASPIRDSYGIDWINVIVIPESDFMADINANKRTTIFLILVAVLLALVFGIFIASWISKPILRLNKSTQSLIKGDFKIIDVERVREIDQLGQSFNSMAKQLEQTILKLKSQIAKRKQNEEALKVSQSRFKEMAENVQDVFWLFDWKEQKVVYVNPAYEKIWGRSVESIINNDGEWLNSIHPDDREYFKKSLSSFLETGTAIIREYRIIRPDGKVRWIADNGFVIKDDKGNIIRIVGIAKDITKQKKNEQRINQSQKMESIGTLAGGIAHDFNNMLGVITGNVSYALSSLNKDDEIYEVLTDVQESSKQAQSLTYQLLTFSKGGTPIKKNSDINRLIKESAVFSTRGAKTSCNFDFSDVLWSAEVDPGQLNQVIGNLIINANQAMPNGGTITIRTKNVEIDSESDVPLPSGRYISIIVEDQGIGISKKYLSNIFEPYYTTKQKGSGLGLATTYSIIKKHGGHIALYSEINKGTVFNIYLPASSNDIIKIKDEEEYIHAGQGKILIMDDQESILDMVGRMLNRMGYETCFATDGSQAVELYYDAYQSESSFDLVILDLTVPGGMGGLKTIIELLKIDTNVKAVVSSGYSNDPIMANYVDYGFCGLLSKPYTMAQLAEVLNRIFSEKD